MYLPNREKILRIPIRIWWIEADKRLSTSRKHTETHRIRRRKSAKCYIARNKARSFLSTILLLGKPGAEPETTSTVTDDIANPVVRRFFPSPCRESETIRVWQIAEPAPRRVAELCPRRRTNERVWGENAAADISVGLIGYPYAALVTWPLRKISRAIRATIHLRESSCDTFWRSTLRTSCTREGKLSRTVRRVGGERVDRKANTVFADSPSICQSCDLDLPLSA